MPRRTLKLKSNTPLWLENRLVNKYNFYVQKRVLREHTIFVKLTKPKDQDGVIIKPDTVEVEYVSNPAESLTEAQKEHLDTRCDRIVDYFPDPYVAIHAVRTRLHNMRQTLQSVAEQQHVLEYMDENFPLEGK